MNYLLNEENPICRMLGHRYGKMYLDYGGVTVRQTCWLDGHTIPPFRKVKQHRLAEGEDPYLPDDQQPPGAM